MRANQLLLALPLVGTALSLPSKRFDQDFTDNTPSLINVDVTYGDSPVQLIHRRRSGQDDDMVDDDLEPDDDGDGDEESVMYRAKVKRNVVSTRNDPLGLGFETEDNEPLDESADIQSHKRREWGMEDEEDNEYHGSDTKDDKDSAKRSLGLVTRQDGFGYEGIASGDDVDEQYEYPIERRQDSGDDGTEKDPEAGMQSGIVKRDVDNDEAEEDDMSAETAQDGGMPDKRNDVFALLENSKAKIFTISAPLNSRTSMGDLRTGVQSINDILQALYDGLGVVVNLNGDDDGSQIQADYSSSNMVKPGSPRYDAARQLAEIVVSIKLLLSRLNLRQKSNGDMLAPLLRLDTVLAKVLRGNEELNAGTLPLLGQMLCSMGFVMDSILQKVVEVLSPGMAECLDSYMSLIASGQLVDTAGKLCVVDLAY